MCHWLSKLLTERFGTTLSTVLEEVSAVVMSMVTDQSRQYTSYDNNVVVPDDLTSLDTIELHDLLGYSQHQVTL